MHDVPGKVLYLLRHAKSSWKDPHLADHDRPLNKRGTRDAPEMARRLAGRTDPPQRIVTSSARRALTTAEVMAEVLALDHHAVDVDPRLYGAGPGMLLEVVHGLDDATARAMIVGHNPGVTDFVNGLAGASIDNVPTCGVAVLQCGAPTWRDVAFGTVTLMTFDFPKNRND